MYNISELNEMGDAELRKVAEDMGLKKIDPTQKEELIYRILDEQAVARASAGAERRRTSDQPEAKKRTRRKKNDETATNEKAPQQQDSDAPASETENIVAPETPRKRRGRPSKKEIEERRRLEEEAAEPSPVATEEASDNTTEPNEAPAEDANKEQADETQTPQPRRDFRPSANADTSLGTFFPRSEGRKFVPRSQHEREEAEKNQAHSPITIAEPGQQLPGQQQSKKNKNRKDRQPQQNNTRFDFAGLLEAAGVLEIEPQGHGFLRSSDFNYMPSPDDIYVSQAQIKQYGLKTGDVVEAGVRPPRENDKYFILTEVLRVNGRSLDFIRDRVPFEHLTPLFPDEKFNITGGTTCNMSTRVVDMFSPIGKGQRALSWHFRKPVRPCF